MSTVRASGWPPTRSTGTPNNPADACHATTASGGAPARGDHVLPPSSLATGSSGVVEEMVSEAHKGETSRLGPVILTTGFALFAAVSVYLGE